MQCILRVFMYFPTRFGHKYARGALKIIHFVILSSKPYNYCNFVTTKTRPYQE